MLTKLARGLWRLCCRLWRRQPQTAVLNLGAGWHCATIPDASGGHLVLYWVLDRRGVVWEAVELRLRPCPRGWLYEDRLN
jgi:hypothetical protein